MTKYSRSTELWQTLSGEGIHLFPLNSKTANFPWATIEKTEPDRLREYLSQNPRGMGIPTGPSGLIVVDIDNKKKDGSQNGFKSIGDDMLFKMIDLENPPVVQTPSGGQHVYFRAPEASTVKSSASKWRENVDIRALGGMVVAPGSNLANGQYRVLYGDFTDIPVVPQWLYNELKEKPKEQRPVVPLAPGGTRGNKLVHEIVREMAYIPETQRNTQLHRRTLVLIERGLLDDYSVSLLVAAAEYAGLEETDIRKTIQSAMRKKGLIN